MNSIYHGLYRVITIEYYALHSPYTENILYFFVKIQCIKCKRIWNVKKLLKKRAILPLCILIFIIFIFLIFIFLSFFETDSFFCLLVFLIILKKATTKNSKIRYLFFLMVQSAQHTLCVQHYGIIMHIHCATTN